jgi:AcrR family transcriptional regulator
MNAATAKTPKTRAEQREATRTALLDATANCLIEEGYAGLTTRRIAERAGVAQSTLMHYFPSREALLTEAVAHVAVRLAEDALRDLDLAALRLPEQREAVLDEAWKDFTSPAALAAAQLWVAASSEPELAAALRELEERIAGLIDATATALFPDQAADPRFPAMIDAGISLIRGLVLDIPIVGRDEVEARWQAIRPLLLEATRHLLDED